MTNLITLDGVSHFPKEFLDLKAFSSNKAQAIVDSDMSQEEDFDHTAYGNKDISRGASIMAPVNGIQSQQEIR